MRQKNSWNFLSVFVCFFRSLPVQNATKRKSSPFFVGRFRWRIWPWQIENQFELSFSPIILSQSQMFWHFCFACCLNVSYFEYDRLCWLIQSVGRLFRWLLPFWWVFCVQCFRSHLVIASHCTMQIDEKFWNAIVSIKIANILRARSFSSQRLFFHSHSFTHTLLSIYFSACLLYLFSVAVNINSICVTTSICGEYRCARSKFILGDALWYIGNGARHDF